MFFEMPKNTNFPGYTLHTYSSKIKTVLDSLQGALKKMFHWCFQ